MTAIIVINWNGADDTIECLRSLEKAGGSFFAVVADNGSADDSVSRIRLCAAELDFRVEVLKLGCNLGFAAGCNRAVGFAEQYNPDSYLFLNNDTVVEPGFLEKLQNYKSCHPEIAVIGPLIRYYNDRNRVWSCGCRLVFGSRKACFRDITVSELPASGAVPVSFISGCALMADSSLVDGRGHLFDESLFFGEEDFEFAHRMRSEGRKMAILTDAAIFHKVGASVCKVSDCCQLGRHYNYYLGRLIVVRKYYGTFLSAIIRLLSRPRCVRWFRKDGLDYKASRALVNRLMSEARLKKGISAKEFQAMMDGTYFEMKSLLFLGALDYPNVPKAGDAVKNRFLLDFFRQRFARVRYVDTQHWKRNPMITVRVMWCLLFSRFDNIVFSTSNVSAYRLARLTTSLRLKSRIYYFMIAGYTPVKIKQGIYKADPFRKLERIVVEADKVCEMFHEVGVDNTYRLYNFKPVLYVPDISVPHDGLVRFVFLSRLTRLKGVFHILQSVRDLNAMGLSEKFCVDFYGRQDPDVKEQFMNETDVLPNVSYRGFLQLDNPDGYRILSGYDAMLFPTMHPTEGFPGVIADAAISALPVIAADWRYAQEIIGDGVCGILIPTGDNAALTEIMRKVIEDRSILEPMRRASLERSRMYDMNNVLSDRLIEELGMS